MVSNGHSHSCSTSGCMRDIGKITRAGRTTPPHATYQLHVSILPLSLRDTTARANKTFEFLSKYKWKLKEEKRVLKRH